MATIRQRLKEATYQLDKARRAASIHPERFSNALIEAMCDGAELHRENQSERRAAQLLREASLYVRDHRTSITASALNRLERLGGDTPETSDSKARPLAKTNEATMPAEEVLPQEYEPPSEESLEIEEPPSPVAEAPAPESAPPPEPEVQAETSPTPEPEPPTQTADQTLRIQFDEWLQAPQTSDPEGVILHYQGALEKIRQAPDDYSQSLSAEIREAAGKIYLTAGKLWDAERMFLLAFRNRLKMKDASESARRVRKTLRMLSEVYDEAGERRIARDYRDSARLREDDAVLKAVEKLVEDRSDSKHAAA